MFIYFKLVKKYVFLKNNKRSSSDAPEIGIKNFKIKKIKSKRFYVFVVNTVFFFVMTFVLNHALFYKYDNFFLIGFYMF